MRTILAVTVGLLAATAVRGADAFAPTLEVRVRAINDLLPTAEYVGALAGQEEQAKQFVAVVRAFAGAKGLEGVDVKRPIGLYAKLTPAMIDSPIVLLVPVADEEAFLNLLTTRLNLNPNKGDDGLYSVKLPNVPPPVYFRFHKGYACGTVLNKAALDVDGLPDPLAFLKTDDPAVASVVAHLDRVPDEVRKSVLGQLELQLADRKREAEGKPKAERLGYELGVDVSFRMFRAMAEEGRRASLRFVIDPRADDLAIEFAMTAKDGSPLRAALASAAKRTGVGRAVGGRTPIASVSAGFEWPEWVQKRIAEGVDAFVADAVEKAKPEERPVAEKVFDAIGPTLKGGVIDFGLSLAGTKPGDLRFAAAARVTDGKRIEGLVRELAPHAPADKFTVRTDVGKAGPANLHTLTVTAPEFKDAVGTDTAWLATTDDLLAIVAGGGEEAVKPLTAARPASGDLFRAEVSLVRLVGLAEKGLTADELQGVAAEAFGGPPAAGADAAVLSVAAGDRLTVRATVKGRAVRFAALVDQKKKAK